MGPSMGVPVTGLVVLLELFRVEERIENIQMWIAVSAPYLQQTTESAPQ